MKVAVTGASGFVGSALCRALGADAVPVVRNASLPSGCGALVHLAAIAHRGASRAELEEANVRLAERVGRQAAAAGIPMLFLSSVKVHGEASSAPLTERSPLAPADAYGESKARAEEALRAIPGLRLAVLRPPLVYGAGVKANFLALLRAIDRGLPLPLASIDNRRSLISVDNLADAVLRSLGTEGTWLVSDGDAVSTPQLCAQIGEALGKRARLFPFPPALLPRKLAASLEVDDAAIRAALGWRPPQTRQAALQATAQWYRQSAR